jgi:hypothetical protein
MEERRVVVPNIVNDEKMLLSIDVTIICANNSEN